MNILIHWKEDYNLNIKEIDQQHKKLFDIINVVYDSMIREEEDEVLGQAISDLSDYAFVHFKVEEKYFEQVGYEDAPFHIAEHRKFLDRIETFRMEYSVNGAKYAKEVMFFLQEWLNNHILHVDKKYMETFIKNGIK
jgi:hemerythrin-like metal-binding protein